VNLYVDNNHSIDGRILLNGDHSDLSAGDFILTAAPSVAVLPDISQSERAMLELAAWFDTGLLLVAQRGATEQHFGHTFIL
jgi:hypothetical protein